MMPQTLTCKEMVELVSDYLEGALPPDERARFEAHIAGCEGCDTYLQQIMQTVRWAGKLKENHLSEQARETLLQTFQRWKSAGRE